MNPEIFNSAASRAIAYFHKGTESDDFSMCGVVMWNGNQYNWFLNSDGSQEVFREEMGGTSLVIDSIERAMIESMFAHVVSGVGQTLQ